MKKCQFLSWELFFQNRVRWRPVKRHHKSLNSEAYECAITNETSKQGRQMQNSKADLNQNSSKTHILKNFWRELALPCEANKGVIIRANWPTLGGSQDESAWVSSGYPSIRIDRHRLAERVRVNSPSFSGRIRNWERRAADDPGWGGG